MEEERPTVWEIALNDLARRSLNAMPWEESENVTEAIDRLDETIRKSALALSIAINAVAESIAMDK